MDIYATELIFPENASLSYTHQYGKDNYFSKDIQVNRCSNPITCPPRFRPIVGRNSEEHMANFPEMGLIFQRMEFKFVSCHQETSHWITQLRECFFAFDTAIRLLLIFISLVIVRIFANISMTH